MEEQVRQHTDKAVELLRLGKLPHAAAEFEQAIRLAPGDVTLRQRLGDVYLRLGLRTHALRELQHVAGRYAADGQLLKAIAICKLILKVDPEHHETLHILADLYALQHGKPPVVPRLPPSMSAAVAREATTGTDLPWLGESAPLDMESLAIFRDALEGVSLPAKAEPSRDDEDETVVRTPRASTIDLGKLPSSPLFCSLNKAGFEALVQKLDLRWVKAGETLVREGEQGDSMFVVVQGVVNVMHGDRVIAVMGEGAFFGEMALITDSPRLASVVAAKDGLLFEVHRARLTDIAAQHPSVSGVIAAFYRERLLANVLRASPVFRPLNGAERDDVAARFVRHSLPPLKEGDIFGEISVLLESPCTATVRTAGYCEVLELPREDFKRLVLPNPAVRALVKKVMTERISRTAELLERENTILPDYMV